MICLEFFYRLTSDWQDLGRPSTGQWNMDAKKEGAKSKATTYTVILKLFAPSTSA